MELLGMMGLIIGLLILIIYFNNSFKKECFYNKSLIELEIEKISEYYSLLRNETNENSKKFLKNKIKESIGEIEKGLIDNYDKYKLNNIYSNELEPLLNKPISKESNEKIIKIINNIDFLVNYALTPERHIQSEKISNIKTDFKSLNELYENVYINKNYGYKMVENKIDILNKQIYNELMQITTYDDLNNSGILLILNTTLKRAYEVNDITQINGLKETFNEKLRSLNLIITKAKIEEKTKEGFDNYYDTNLQALINQPTTSISLFKDKDVIKKIQEKFNKIYNSFDILNSIYKNNGNRKQIDELKRVISDSIDEIISYNEKDIIYKAKILSIKNVIIASVLDKELEESYLTQNENQIIKVKNKFYDAIIEIKNIIISVYSKEKYGDNKEACLKDIIDALLNNDYPIEIKKIHNCKDISNLLDDNIMITPKIAVSSNKGKTWEPATEFTEYKRKGETDDPYIYTQKLATSVNGKKWNLL